MLATMFPKARDGGSGPVLFWALAFMLLFPLAIVSLFSFAPVTTALAVAAAIGAALMRARIVGELASILALVLGIASVTFAVAVVEEHRSYSYFHGEYSSPHYPLPVAPWFNIGHVSSSLGEMTVRLDTSGPMPISGDLLLRTSEFERRRYANELRCDTRCIVLLKQPGVTSVTIQPDPDIWREGPRAVMPGFVPDAQTFSLRQSDICLQVWKRPLIDYTKMPRGAAIEAFHRSLDREGEPCLLSSPATGRLVCDREFDPDIEFQEWVPDPLPPGAVI